MSHFKPYPAYKDSGVAWLGTVPADWKPTTLSYLADYLNGYPFAPEQWSAEGLPIIRIAQLTGKPFDNFYAGAAPEHLRVEDGDLLFSWSATIDCFIWERGSAWLNQHIFRVLPSKDADKRFLYHLLRHVAPKLAEFDAHGSTMRHIKKESLKERVFVPDLSTQATIATYLDRETTRIDALIEKKTRFIELLREKRQALITHAVTKGLDPKVKMKDSGVEWLGEVPEHWACCPFKYFCLKVTDGAHISPETEGGVRYFVSTKDIVADSINFEGALLTTEASFQYLVKTGCNPLKGDILFSKDGTIGRTVVVGYDIEFVVASSLIIIRPNPLKINPEYLNYFFQSKFFASQVEGFVRGAGLPRISIQNLLKIIGAFPPVFEQLKITEKLKFESNRIERLVSKTERSIELLKERRSALITAAVTGQIDLREAA